LPVEKLNELLTAHHRQVLLQRWPNMKLGCLDGKTPREALAEGVYKVRVLAAIMVFEEIAEGLRCRVDFNELRGKLGLPVLGPIDPETVNPMTQPMNRLSRLLPDKLNDEQLKWAFRMAAGYHIHKAIRIFGEEMIRRPSYADKPELVEVYSRLSEEEENFDRALEYVEAGRQVLEKAGRSHVRFDFQELHLRYARRDPENILRLIQHIDRVHGKEPEVSLMLTHTLIQFGMLRPDGTPAFPMRGPAPEEMPAEPAAEPGKLWTPDSVASDTGGGSKLWTPE
jgi:hypothetical protein